MQLAFGRAIYGRRGIVGHARNVCFPPTSRRLFGAWFLRFIDQCFWRCWFAVRIGWWRIGVPAVRWGCSAGLDRWRTFFYNTDPGAP